MDKMDVIYHILNLNNSVKYMDCHPASRLAMTAFFFDFFKNHLNRYDYLKHILIQKAMESKKLY